MQERSANPGEIIFREGEDSDFAYQILSGQVEIYKSSEKGTILLAKIGEGEVFGEMGLISDKPRSAYAAAVSDVRLRVITREDIASALTGQPELVHLIIRVLTERVRESSQTVAALITHYSGKMELAPAEDKPKPVKRVTLLPLSDTLKRQMPANGVVISSFPYRVGALPMGAVPNPMDWNNLFIENADPAIMARNHFAIQPGEKGLAVTDRGSKTGTVVNGVKIGGNAPDFRAHLRVGENEIVAGAADSPYRFTLVWE
ncbi:MAG: cyclic nucleotide-binding domain-containing protein [Alphaproteobacteria bacterium]|nr:cyclic nucleotide-binding domain-containing protein [Alphaproteobacteria bacterium]